MHIGYDSPFAFGIVAGFRSWQDIGTTYMASSDNFYVGLRQKAVADPTGRTSAALATPNDAQDAVLSWGDNYSGNGPAPDNNLTFIFHAPLNPGNKYAGSEYGREVMRMNGDGNVGLGPVFADNVQPTSTLHQHQQDAESSWMQITNQYMTQATAIQTAPTAINAINGFRFGILGDANVKDKNGNAFIYNQEERHLIFSTNHTTPTNAQTTLERMRITNISAPTNLTNTGNSAFGVWNPGSLPNQDVTRVAISHNPTTPITRPMSLLHLGYNTGIRYYHFRQLQMAGDLGWTWELLYCKAQIMLTLV